MKGIEAHDFIQDEAEVEILSSPILDLFFLGLVNSNDDGSLAVNTASLDLLLLFESSVFFNGAPSWAT
jgi:hypothetical protein